MAESDTSPQPLRLGAFLGVFTPTVLTILGVIMYLRTGWLVGNAGLGGALAIVLFANAITLMSALSMSALATNMKVGVGGAYFLISRSLGLEVGGAIGIPLYLSQALSVTLYAYGLAESLIALSPWPWLPGGPFAAAVILGVGAVAARSTTLALKLQLPIMGLIALSIGSLFVGVEWGGSVVPFVGPWEDAGFWGVFAVFFPAVTGILAGVSLSGDLADPGRAIPRGVLSAVAVGAVVYLLVPFALASGAVALEGGAATLRDDQMVWTTLAAVPALVLPGMWGAILSSAFGSVLAAPRTLQALAQDRLAPRRLGDVDPKTGEPLVALRITIGIALAAVLLGDLNAVAAVLTMFYLTTYGTLNLVAGLEDLVGDPSFRPRIRIPWTASLLGAIGCFVAMFAIHPLAAAVAILVEVVIFWTLQRRSMRAAWGDVRSGLWLAAARYVLLALREARVEPRNWRPHILVFSADLTRDLEMVRLADDLSQARGIVTVSTLLVGDLEEHPETGRIVTAHQRLLDAEGIVAFPEVAAVQSLDAGMVTVAQVNGMAGLDSNTVLVGWAADDPERIAGQLALVRKLAALEKSTLLARLHGGPGRPGNEREVVVWWKGLEHNGDLMLLLAHLLSLSERWRGASIVLKSVVDDADQARERQRELSAFLPDLRIDASVEVVVSGDESVTDIIRRHSSEADLVFLGLGAPAAGEEQAYAEGLVRLVDGLPNTVLVRNAGPFRGRLV